MIRLYDYPKSSASYRVRIALNLLSLDYERIPIDLLKAEQHAPSYLTRNPQGLVPSLDIDGQTLTQSLAIIDYLGQQYNAQWLPQDPLMRSTIQALTYSIAIDIHPICNLSVANLVVEGSGGKISKQAWMQHFIAKGLAASEQLLSKTEAGDYCHGNQITLADICLVPQMYNARRWHISTDAIPKLVKIDENLRKLEAFASAAP